MYQITISPVTLFLQRISAWFVAEEDLSVKAALTLVLVFIVTWQVMLVPEHAADHPVKVEFVPAVAVRATTVPALKVVPVGLLVIVPVPVPVVAVLRVYVFAVKVAAMVRFAVTLENV